MYKPSIHRKCSKRSIKIEKETLKTKVKTKDKTSNIRQTHRYKKKETNTTI